MAYNLRALTFMLTLNIWKVKDCSFKGNNNKASQCVCSSPQRPGSALSAAVEAKDGVKHQAQFTHTQAVTAAS